MDPKSAGQWIRDHVEMKSILDLYGYTTKHGFMVCPFHGDRDASLKVYGGERGWHCYGCGRGGSVIDFVMEHESCNYRTAVVAIDKGLHLGLMDGREDPEEADRKKRVQDWLDDFVKAVITICDIKADIVFEELRRDLHRMQDCERRRKMEPPQLTAGDYDFMNQWREVSLYNEYRLDRIAEFKEEVAAWRRKRRRATSA